MTRTHHLVIAGTGRAGTTFLVEYLAACGLDVGASDMAYYERARAGLERSLLGDRSAYVVKDPWFHEIAPLLPLDEVAVDAVIVPVRDLRAVATSRLRNEVADLVEQGFPPGRTAMGRVPGGAVYALDVESQMRTLALGQALLLQWCVEHSVEVCFLAYPRLVDDHDYLYAHLARWLPPTLRPEDAAAAFDRVRRPTHPAAEPSAAGPSDRQRTETLIWELEQACADRDRALERLDELERLVVDASAEAAAARESLAAALQTMHELEARAGAAAETEAELRRLQAALETFQASEAYRIGLAVTWPARHAKRLLRRG